MIIHSSNFSRKIVYLIAAIFFGGAEGAFSDETPNLDKVQEIISYLNSKDNLSLDSGALSKFSEKERADALSALVASGENQHIRRLVEAGADPNAVNTRGANALITAVTVDNIDAVITLISLNADPAERVPLGRAIDYADQVGSHEMKMAITGSSGINNTDRLRSAARQGDVEAVKEFIETGVDVNNIDSSGVTALVEAVQASQIKAAEILLQNGAKADLPNVSLPAIALSISQGDIETTGLLLKNGASVNQMVDGMPLLSIAAATGSKELVELLLQAGADPRAKDAEGVTAAMVADVIGDQALVTRLGGTQKPALHKNLFSWIERGDDSRVVAEISNGVEVNSTNADGYSLLLFAVAFSNIDVVDALIKAGADVNFRGPNGITVIHSAYSNKDQNQRRYIVARLLKALEGDKEKDVLEATDKDGRSGIVLIAAEPIPYYSTLSFEIALFIQRKNSRIYEIMNREDSDGVSPYMAAVLSRNLTLVKELKKQNVYPRRPANGPSLHDVARAKQYWDILAAMPSDRDLPLGLKLGSGQPERSAVQEKLREWGYYKGQIDGQLGAGSRAALTAFLKDREAELIKMGGSEGYLKSERPQAKAGDVKLSVVAPVTGENCRWEVVHWQDKKDTASKFIGCVKATESAWNANGFGLVTYSNGDSELSLFGPNGWDGRRDL